MNYKEMSNVVERVLYGRQKMKILEKFDVAIHGGKRIPLIIVEGITSISVEKYKLLLKGEKKELIEEKYEYEKPRECFSKPRNLVVGLYSYNLEEIECITDVYLIYRKSSYETDIDKAEV